MTHTRYPRAAVVTGNPDPCGRSLSQEPVLQHHLQRSCFERRTPLQSQAEGDWSEFDASARWKSRWPGLSPETTASIGCLPSQC